jgi:hypothetical protein
MQELIGKTLDKTYHIERLLDQGGMGAVYQAHDLTLDCARAIKVMHPHHAANADFCARFLREARAIAALSHPGIVQVHACGQDLGILYILRAMDKRPEDRYATAREMADAIQVAISHVPPDLAVAPMHVEGQKIYVSLMNRLLQESVVQDAPGSATCEAVAPASQSYLWIYSWE